MPYEINIFAATLTFLYNHLPTPPKDKAPPRETHHTNGAE